MTLRTWPMPCTSASTTTWSGNCGLYSPVVKKKVPTQFVRATLGTPVVSVIVTIAFSTGIGSLFAFFAGTPKTVPAIENGGPGP